MRPAAQPGQALRGSSCKTFLQGNPTSRSRACVWFPLRQKNFESCSSVRRDPLATPELAMGESCFCLGTASPIGPNVNIAILSIDDLAAERIYIEDVYPLIDDGRFAVKRIAGDPVDIWVDIFRDGHALLAA